ncbi:MAG: ABC-F family ATP-binding cassette domain-containing protein [Lachnospiraceae bacterium]|nr:ABC-F family ATP-binding cassette domain-containing protein [Lachnospiraceae bacterium]
MIISASDITKYFGDDKVLDKVSLQINDKEKYAICGSNGRGKSTLLKIIIGEIEADSGSVNKNKNIKVGYLAQYNDGEDSEASIIDTVINARSDLMDMESRLHELEQNMSDKEDILEHEDLLQKFEEAGGLVYKSLAKSILNGLGFDDDEFSKKLNMLSGGERTRVGLAKLLISNNDLLILDEPINHLDMNAIIWLEDYLSNLNIPLIIVAHDRYFLDRTVDHVLDLNTEPAICYTGNYTQFMAQKENRMLTNQREVDKQDKEIRHQKEVIKKLQSFNREKSIKRAESRIKALDKMDRVTQIKDNISDMHLLFNTKTRSGDDVLSVNEISCIYDDGKIFENVSFDLKRTERAALLGDNGTGKSTILKMITGLKEPTGGTITLGSNVSIGYYDQAQMNLDDNNTIFEEIHNMYPSMNNTVIRNALAKVGFIEDDANKSISALSGGEKAKVSLCKLMLSDANFLILDEPTNHLDMESKDILEHALNEYEGTLLFVSHDRYFINKVTNKILELTDNGINEYIGDYDYYIEKKDKVKNRFEFTESKKETAKSNSKDDWKKQKEEAARLNKIKKELKLVEEKIELLENELSDIDSDLSNSEIATNSFKLNELTEKKSDIEHELEPLYERWETLSLELA